MAADTAGRPDDEGGVGTAGDSYAALIGQQLAEERQNKVSLEHRGITVISTSGAAAGLVTGVAAAANSNRNLLLGSFGRWLLVLAVSAFILAAVAAIVTTLPRKYSEADPEGLERLLKEEFWQAQATIGARRTAELSIEILKRARELNARKARWLTVALVAEMGAISLLAVALMPQVLSTP